jgi:uncharacterized membrane protein
MIGMATLAIGAASPREVEPFPVAAAYQVAEEQVVIGKLNGKKFSPIVQAIALAETGTTGEIRVHLSKRWFERDPYFRAVRLFTRFQMNNTSQRNAVLLYVNLRKKKFAVVGDTGVHQKVGQEFWENLAATLRQDLQSTHPERAISSAVETVGKALQKFFPADRGSQNINELPDEVTEY